MSNSTVFANGTVVQPAWLNDINAAVYQGQDFAGIQPFNVKAYPYLAKGDGVTNDYAAINSAITVAATVGGVVWLPPGIYLIGANTINMQEGVSLIGSGRRSSLSPPTTQLVFTANVGANPSIKINGLGDVTLKDFYLSGRSSGIGAEISCVGNNRRIRIDGIIVNSSTTGPGIDLASDNVGYVINSVVMGCDVLGCGQGYNIGVKCTSVAMVSNYANLNTQGFVTQGTYISYVAGAADTNSQYGYVWQGAKACTMIGSGAENQGRSAMIFSGANDIEVRGFRSVSNNTGASVSIASLATINDSSFNITITGAQDTTPNAATVNSVNNTSGTVGNNIEIIGTFSLPVSAAVLAKETPRQALYGILVVSITATVPTLVASRNIVQAGIVRNSIGDYTLTWTTPQQTRYLACQGNATSTAGTPIEIAQVANSATTTQIRFRNTITGALIDPDLAILECLAL